MSQEQALAVEGNARRFGVLAPAAANFHSESSKCQSIFLFA